MKGLGLENNVIEFFDKDLALKRILKDIQSDFIFAPHLNIVFHQAGDELFEQLTSKLKSGKYCPRLPITINVIKPNGFNRVGAILEPLDRLAYQLVVDLIAQESEKIIDRRRVFSNKLIEQDIDGFMFEKSSESYNSFRNYIEGVCLTGEHNYVLRADIASYFDRLYQHVLGNLLYSTEANKKAISFLEKFLLQLSQSDSHGIVQGIFPSDFLGNFCLCAIDAQHSLIDIEFARYVDDMYIFFKNLNEAKVHRVRLANWLRKDGLTLNESKTKIYDTQDLLREESELDNLFEDAKKEVVEGTINMGYETNLFWDLEANVEMDDAQVDLEATKRLFDAGFEGDVKRKVEKFCLPVFTAFDDDYGLDYVIRNYVHEPSMSVIYFGYLNKMIRKSPSIVTSIEDIFGNPNLLFDYQRLWLYATLLYAENVSDLIIRSALKDLQNQTKSSGLRSICAILIGKYGSAPIKQILKTHYSNENSEFVKSAILFAAQYFPSQLRDVCFNAWAGHSETNSLIVAAIKKSRTTSMAIT
jgi:hypothetical protein